MQENIDRFDEIEAFIQGELNTVDQIAFLKRLREDDALYNDFQLWTKLEAWFEEKAYYDIEVIVDEQIREEKSESLEPKKKKLIRLSPRFRELAACLALISSLWLLVYKQFYNLHELNGTFQYNKALSVNSITKNDENNTSLKYRVQSVEWKIEKSLQNDTTYQLIIEGDDAKKFLLRVPEVKHNFGRESSIYFNNSINGFVLKTKDKRFILRPTKGWTKLKLLPPK
jgi:hypothetical protein